MEFKADTKRFARGIAKAKAALDEIAVNMNELERLPKKQLVLRLCHAVAGRPPHADMNKYFSALRWGERSGKDAIIQRIREVSHA